MDPNSLFAISAAGMALERARVEAAALNLANVHTSGEPGFTPVRVVAETSGGRTFASHFDAGSPLRLAPQYRLEGAPVAPRLVLDPGHPHADAKGLVAYPGVDPASEMMTLMSATRAYEANVAAMNAARTMAQKALEIGGNS